jgi:UDP-2,3-diacylglucosamine pyrophosphatase LpxH
MRSDRDTEYSLLVLSDLHLGEDLSPSSTEATRGYIDLVERQLVEFFRHYTYRRDCGRPWRVVVNGDMVDFLAVCVFPVHPDVQGDDWRFTAEDHVFGLARHRRIATTKLEAVFKRHRELFRAMVRFVAHGNRIEIVCGNHDIEFHWSEVQEVFKDGLLALWKEMPESSRRGAITAEALRDGIGFHPWFFYEKGVAWIEHGHRYDECCSFDHTLNPVRHDAEQIAVNVDTAASRYVTNYVREADPHSSEDWSFFGYARFGISLGLRGLMRLSHAYYMFTVTLLALWRSSRRNRREREAQRDLHEERLRQLSGHWQIPEDALRAIDELRREPVVTNLRRLASVLMVDRLFIYLTALVAAAAGVLLLPTTWGVMWSAAALGVSWLLTRRDRSVDPVGPLSLVPERILKYVDAQFVLFGHSHEPVAQRLEGGAWYFNSGTWVPAGKPGLLRAFTHIMIRRTEQGPQASLCQWNDGASQPFVPGPMHPAGEEVREPVMAPARGAAKTATVRAA